MIKDRLDELHKGRQKTVIDFIESQIDQKSQRISRFLDEASRAKSELEAIRRTLSDLEYAYSDFITSPFTNYQMSKRISENERHIMSSINKVRGLIPKIDPRFRNHQKINKNSAEFRIYENHCDKIRKDVDDLNENYKFITTEFERQYQQKVKRHMEISGDLHHAKYNTVVCMNPASVPFSAQPFLLPNASNNNNNYDILYENMTCLYIRDRDVSKIEARVTELRQLFNDVNSLLSNQGYKVETIECKVRRAQSYIDEGVHKHLVKAKKCKRKLKRKKLIAIISAILAFVTGVLVAVLVVL